MTLLAALCLMLWPPSEHGRWPIPASYRARAEAAAPLILRAVELEGGDPVTLGAVLVKESGLYPHRRGLNREYGMAQIHPDTGRETCPDLDWAREPADNVRCAARRLDKARAVCRSERAAWSAYNGRGCKADTRYSRAVAKIRAATRGSKQ